MLKSLRQMVLATVVITVCCSVAQAEQGQAQENVIQEQIYILTPEDKQLFSPLEPLLRKAQERRQDGKTTQNLGLNQLPQQSNTPITPSPLQAQPYAYDSVEVKVSQAHVIELPEQLLDLFIADATIADVQTSSANTFYVYGRQPGRTTIICYGLNQKVVRIIDLRVIYDVSELERMMRSLVPDARLEIQSTPRGILLGGNVATAQDANTVQQLTTQYLQSLGAGAGMLINNVVVSGANQVNLQVRVAEVSRDVGELIGFNVETALRGNPNTFSLSGRTFRPPQQTGTGGAGTGTGVSNILDAIGGEPLNNLFRSQQGQNFLLGFTGSWGALYAVLDVLEDENLVTTLAKPNLTSVSGETARFLAGGEIGIPSAGGVGAGTSVTFRSFGVQLEFTPTILSSGRISLQVNVSVSNISASNATTAEGLRIPGFTTRQASTTVDVASGQSFAIAGLLQSDVNNSVEQYPFLAHIPILGSLFRSDSFQRRESELVIIVTPLLVEPRVADDLHTPQDNTHFNSQFERILTRRIFEYEPEEPQESGEGDETEAPSLRGKQLLKMPRFLDVGGFMVDE